MKNNNIAGMARIPAVLRAVLLTACTAVLGFSAFAIVSMDRKAPVIESNNLSVEYGKAVLIHELATISDDKDEDPSFIMTGCSPKGAVIEKEGKEILFQDIGDYVVTAEGEDDAGNKTEAEISVSVFDATAPEILLRLQEEYQVLEEIPVSSIASVRDEIDSSSSVRIIACTGSGEIREDGEAVFLKLPGSYSIGLMAEDASGNSKKTTVSVTVANHKAPVIHLTESEITFDESVTEMDFRSYATAESEVYGDLTEDIQIDASSVAFGAPGSYRAVFLLTDLDGNQAEEVLKVSILDTLPPEMVLGAPSYTITLGDARPDYSMGLRAEDACDGDLTGAVVIDDSAVDYDRPGTYTVVYEVEDAARNSVRQEAAVTIAEKPVERSVPVIEEPAAEPSAEYILNKNTRKFHYPWCSSVDQMKEKNKIYFEGSRGEAISKGYDPCKRCNP